MEVVVHIMASWLVEMDRLYAYVRRTSLPISALCSHAAFAPRFLQQISSPPNLSLRFFMNFVSRGDESRNGGGGGGSLLRTENRRVFLPDDGAGGMMKMEEEKGGRKE